MKDAWLLTIGLGWIVWGYWPSWREAWERRRARRLTVTYSPITPNEAFIDLTGGHTHG